MTIIAKVYFSHPDMALANVIMTLPDLEFRVLQEVSTDPEHDQYFIVVETDDVEGLEEALDGDHTVASAQRMSEYDDQLVYGIEFAPQAILLASRVTSEGGFSLEAHRHDEGWIERWQLPDRESLREIWEFAQDEEFTLDIRELYRITDQDRLDSGTLTDQQRRTLAVAYANGYFDEPRDITLEGLAEELDISPTAASGRLRRGMKKLVESSIHEVTD
ncbi:helix-turn-helix domain-containing protein [Haloarculaceae archaeon H-GB1-1]|nr:helix-turn-helix domain-containing protein [Haloarculaceae archaeon H-GB1-1]